jgi:prepilin-type N-terminal cleavage/methylation domain-containing protein
MMKDLKGFTIIELLIATSVFGLLLTIALAGFTGIGNIFYKGVAITQTQSSTSQVLRDVTANIQTASAVSTPVNTIPATGKGYWYFCTGGVRYSFLLQREIDPAQDENLSLGNPNMALVKDILPSANGCAPPCTSGCSTPFNNPQEMLTGRMRLMDFTIVGAGAQLYNIYITVAYGDDDNFNNLGDPATIECVGGLSQQKFCAVNRLSTSVYQGLHS